MHRMLVGRPFHRTRTTFKNLRRHLSDEGNYHAWRRLQGGATGSVSLSSAASIGGPDEGEDWSPYVGYSVGTLGDWSGDGADEIAIGGWGMPYVVKYWYAGRTWVVSSDDL